MYFVGGESDGCTDGVVACAFDMWESYVPIDSLFVVGNGEQELGETLESLVGKKSDRASPGRDVMADEDVGRAGGSELSFCSGLTCRRVD